MRWILCGKNNAAVECLEFLLERGDEVWVVGSAGDDGKDNWQRSLRGAAAAAGVAFEAFPRINRAEAVERLAKYRAHALISIQYDQVLRGDLLQSIGCPCVNFHFALLPRHRGVAPVAWAVRSGDAEAGVTLHHMVEELDAGDVIAQRAVPIRRTDTAREVYDGISRATVDLFREVYPFPPELLTQRMTQDSADASYHRKGDFDFSSRRIDWSLPAEELHRWIRAMIFPPLQYPEAELGGRWLRVARLAAELGEPVDRRPGTILAHDERGVEVAAADRSIVISEVVEADDRAVPASRAIGPLSPGDRLL